MRRWEPNKTYRVNGLQLRVVPGRKFAGDLRLDAFIGGEWRNVEMALAFFMVDFLAENEQARYHADPKLGWRQNGDRYFLSKCIAAVRDGWVSVTAELDGHRRRKGL